MDNYKKQEDYSWIELAALLPDNKMIRNKFVQIGDTKAIDTWCRGFNNTDIFYSICIYAKPDFNSKFKVPIFFDIDNSENLELARESAITICELIKDRIKVPEDQQEIYFSGNKGFHIIVPCEVCKSFYSPIVFGLYKYMAEKAKQQGALFVDTMVYSPKRLIRISNSRHRKTGLFKIPLFFEELRDCNVVTIKKMAMNPRGDDSFVIPQPCPEAVDWYQRAIKAFENQNDYSTDKYNTQFKEGWRIPPCIKTIQRAYLIDGIRHQTYLALARFYSWIGMHHDEAIEQIESINNRHPIKNSGDIERIVFWSINNRGFPGCDNPILKKYCQKQTCFYVKLKQNNKE
ncbi:hypothetical protein ACFLZ8_02975 [Planctomycetota bacterium]